MASAYPETVDIFGEPVWFIRSKERGVFECNPDVVQQLEHVDKQLVVVVITGLYRTGKSYLMNRLAGRNNGFPLGSTYEAETKGIWIWCRNHPYQSGRVVVLLDTEGLGDIHKVSGRDGDTKIMTLALLLSSCFVYNVMKMFDSDALEKLEDFDLKLIDKDGRQITPNQFLENCIRESSGETGKHVRENFKERSCFVFDRPCDCRSQLNKLEYVEESELNANFKEQSDEFVTTILRDANVKSHNNTILDGKVFCTLVQKCITSINNGTVPSMNDIFTTLVMDRNQEALDAAITSYTGGMQTKLKRLRTSRKLYNLHKEYLSSAVKLRADILGPIQVLDVYVKRFQDKVDATFNKLKVENEKSSIEMLNRMLTVLYKEVHVSEDISEAAGLYNDQGYDEYQARMNDLREIYLSTKDYAGMRDLVYQEFIASKEGIDKMLLMNQQQAIAKKREIISEKQRMEELTEATNSIKNELVEIHLKTQRNLSQFNETINSYKEELRRYKRDRKATFKRKVDKFKKTLKEEYNESIDELKKRRKIQKRALKRVQKHNERELKELSIKLEVEKGTHPRRRYNYSSSSSSCSSSSYESSSIYEDCYWSSSSST